jgi:hypothetical protein
MVQQPMLQVFRGERTPAKQCIQDLSGRTSIVLWTGVLALMLANRARLVSPFRLCAATPTPALLLSWRAGMSRSSKGTTFTESSYTNQLTLWWTEL